MGELETLRARVAELQARLRETEARAEHLACEAELQHNRAMHLQARLSAILSISAALLLSRDVDAIVRLVVNEAVNLFPGTSVAHLYLVDGETDRLMLRGGGNAHTCDQLVGLASLAILSPRAMLLVGPELEFALDQLADADREALRALLPHWPPSSALITPVRLETQRLGALVLYGGINAHLYHPRDLPFVQALGDLTAIAIDEVTQRARAAALQRDLAITQSLHAEAQARLNTAQAQLLQSAKLAAVGE
ncbi:MAG: GAF domain-containing protein, partial [Chloroflexaceae bacterium]|nr:GAF domain-containing protein [Chloroflexaceae bacterium]